MKYRIILSYLLASFLPPIVMIIKEFSTEREDCPQCNALILVLGLLILGKLLLVHAVQFLGLIQWKNKVLDNVLVIVCSFSSSLILAFTLMSDLLQGERTSDWNVLWFPALVNFLLGFFTFWVLKSIRRQKI